MTDIAAAPAPAPAQATASPVQGPPILSFPAILRHPGLSNRFAHLQGDLQERAAARRAQNAAAPAKKRQRDQNDGKRWSIYFTFPSPGSMKDYGIPPPQTRPTFPEPLPPCLPRTVKLPASTQPPPTDPVSANAGRFSLSLKGMRKELRRQGGRAEALIKDIEGELLNWLHLGGTVLYPDRADVIGPNTPNVDGIPIGDTRVVVEVSRTPLQLVWRIPDDAFARYVVHCCARYHEIVSFSKGDGEQRLTYLLRPNVTRPDHQAPNALDTPPTTDMDYNSNTESNIDSDFVSDRDLESDMESHDDALSAIDETASLSSPAEEHPDPDNWSLVGDADADVESSNELEIEAGVEALSLSSPGIPNEDDPDKTFTTPIRPLHRPYPLSASRRVFRSASSPSRSPVRVRRRALAPGTTRVNGTNGGKRTLYEFAFL
ncbi:hypothetical protein EST38_g2882 [Candolleomyces aberdarensis]|uniref:Uncharacterized protein n=1 Tax=Candolleomyces aberdarensis TaxID=2316362 RepID=A0A4Q2DRZ0_9AGAR|nr:hypothetical protein EST38_g2882 [Candolleomyces aberdarensis]